MRSAIVLRMPLAVIICAIVAMIAAAPVFAQKAAKLKQTQFGDGTGSIGIPAGWKLAGAYRGSAQCEGPGGALVALGVPWTILLPGSAAAETPAGAQHPTARSGDLIGALREVIVKLGNATLKSVRTRPAPPAVPGAPAVYALYEYVQNGKRYVALSYLTALDYGGGSPAWQLYASAVIAPKDKFTKLLPTMMAMWKSWRPNGKAPLAGSESAKVDAIIRDRYNSLDKIQKQFREEL